MEPSSAGIAPNIEDANLEIEKLKLKYQPIIQVHTEMLDKYKEEHHDLQEQKKLLESTLKES